MPTVLDVPWSNFKSLPSINPPEGHQNDLPCPFCRTDAGAELLRLDNFQCFEDRDGTNRITHRVVFCQGCGQIYTNPWFTREAASRLLEKAGASYGHCNPGERVDWVLSRVPGAESVLDLGCGDGSFLGGFPGSFSRFGIDSDPQLISVARKGQSEVTFRHHHLDENFDIPNVDVITLFHLLEHVTEPRDLLTRLHRAAGKNTGLVVEVPVLDRAIEIQGPDLCGFFSIPHRTHFSRYTLDRMLGVCGWEIEQRTDLAGNGYRVMARQGEPVLKDLATERVKSEGNLARNYMECRHNSIVSVGEIIDRLPDPCKIMIWGAGHHTEFLAGLTPLFSAGRRFVIVDRDPLKAGMKIHGIPVLAPGDVPCNFWQEGEDMILISSYTWQNPIYEGLVEKGVAPSRIIRLYP